MSLPLFESERRAIAERLTRHAAKGRSNTSARADVLAAEVAAAGA